MDVCDSTAKGSPQQQEDQESEPKISFALVIAFAASMLLTMAMMTGVSFAQGSGAGDTPGNTQSSSDPTVYSQANSQGLDAWRVYDNTPAGASISLVDDELSASMAIEFAGDGARNGYLLGSVSTDEAAWNNREQFMLQWRLRASEAFGWPEISALRHSKRG